MFDTARAEWKEDLLEAIERREQSEEREEGQGTLQDSRTLNQGAWSYHASGQRHGDGSFYWGREGAMVNFGCHGSLIDLLEIWDIDNKRKHLGNSP